MATSQKQESFAFYDEGAENTKQTARAIITGLIIGAILAAVLGTFFLVSPQVAAIIAGLLLGIYFLVRGIVRFIAGVFAPGISAGGRTLSIIFGVLLIALGVFAMRDFENGVMLLGILIGLSWIIDGLATLVESGRAASRGWAIFAGIVSVAAGIVVLTIPSLGVEVLVLIAGIFLVVFAVLQIVAAITLGVKARKLK